LFHITLLFGLQPLDSLRDLCGADEERGSGSIIGHHARQVNIVGKLSCSLILNKLSRILVFTDTVTITALLKKLFNLLRVQVCDRL
jgi:hypothetical protein